LLLNTLCFFESLYGVYMLAPLPLGSPYCILGAWEHITWVTDAAPYSPTSSWPVGCEIVWVGLKLAWRGAEGPWTE
jgi:hypothetical protein